jgi:heme-degrading monooxygenase HmoA
VIAVVWEFVVRADSVEEFERAYGPGGDWARLFAAHHGFRGTVLLRDLAYEHRYLTVDSWESAEDRAAMLGRARDEYARIDRACEALTESERELGTLAVVRERED